MQKITKTFFKKYYPKRDKKSHKSLNGKILIVAGSKNMPGAAILSALAAYRCGAGLVTIAAANEIAAACACALPETIVLNLPSTNGCLNKKTLKIILDYLNKNQHDVILAGPGLAEGAQIVPSLLSASKLPAVLDADALNYLAKTGPDKLDRKTAYILTPHQGEMKRLLNSPKINPQTAAQELYQFTGAVSLLKGPGTQVYYNGSHLANTTGNEGLAKAGSGDVLAGVIAAIFAQLLKRSTLKNNHEKAFYAAAMGVYMHGLAADKAAEKLGKIPLMARDVCDEIPALLKQNPG